ncbi:hypothetical protein [Streptomyces sp. NPDC005407]|uniref:hypothetical protein n=1 Tax=Streptomyces sp. NPDC005407 TaxID=3155340 RepID=UPI0033B51048
MPHVLMARSEATVTGPQHQLGLQPRYDQRREIEEILDTIERILADPLSAVGADRRRSALGAPGEVTVRELAGVPAQALSEYLDRHPGDDSLVEKALLACAASGHQSDDDFEDVLRRHQAQREQDADAVAAAPDAARVRNPVQDFGQSAQFGQLCRRARKHDVLAVAHEDVDQGGRHSNATPVRDLWLRQP